MDPTTNMSAAGCDYAVVRSREDCVAKVRAVTDGKDVILARIAIESGKTLGATVLIP